jgi:hypothetical protein
MKPQSAKAKGRNLQKWVVEQLQKRFPQLRQGDLVSTSMGAGGEDVKLSPAARDAIPYQFECKSLAKVAVYNYYEQAKTHGNHEPVAVVKQNGKKPLVVVDAEVFFDLIARSK